METNFIFNNIFAVFVSELDAETFHAYWNTKHKNIKFAYEKQIGNKLPFLDVLISNNENLQASVFHKKTYKGSCLIILASFEILINMA